MPEKDLRPLENVPILIPSCCSQRGLSDLGVSWVPPWPVHLTDSLSAFSGWPSAGISTCVRLARLFISPPNCPAVLLSVRPPPPPVCLSVQGSIRLSARLTLLLLFCFLSFDLSSRLPLHHPIWAHRISEVQGRQMLAKEPPATGKVGEKNSLSLYAPLRGVVALTLCRDPHQARPGAELSLSGRGVRLRVTVSCRSSSTPSAHWEGLS